MSNSSIGTLEYKDGAPSKETVAKVYDYLDLMHGVEAFVNAYQGASVAAIFKGFEDAGVPNNTALIFSELMDAKSLFLTTNADTVYFWVNLDVTKGPIVVETPPLVARRRRRHVVPVGNRLRSARSRPGRGRQVPVCAARLQRRAAGAAATSFTSCARPAPRCSGRSFLENNDPKPRVALIKKTLKIYPYLPGGYGTSIGSALQGEGDTGAYAGSQTGLGLSATARAGQVHRRHRQGHEHHAAERLQLLRDAQ